MKPAWVRVFILSAAVILSTVVGNSAISHGVKSAKSETISALLTSPWVIAGILLLIGWMIFRMALLSITPMSIILPLTAGIAYILTALAGRFVLHETLGRIQMWGLALIFVGVLLIGTSDSRDSDSIHP